MAQVLARWYRCYPDGTGVRQMVQVLPRWHRCYPDGTGDSQMAQVLPRWYRCYQDSTGVMHVLARRWETTFMYYDRLLYCTKYILPTQMWPSLSWKFMLLVMSGLIFLSAHLSPLPVVMTLFCKSIRKVSEIGESNISQDWEVHVSQVGNIS